MDLYGNLDSSNVSEAVGLYKKLLKTDKSDTYPIFEVKDHGHVMLLMSDKWFGGNIRGTFLIDKKTLEIKKVQFEHKAESEGFGAAISLSPFEDQIVGMKVDFGENTFGLHQNDKNIIKGNKIVDGISGATLTSRLMVEMVNEALIMYKDYFIQK
ncbi:FMN-binding protein [Flagellimonas baculiformis]|uniref:FMN-binding protein n=1 Tax=Flagellimonas baculiformis TaxID=3067310 RepID=UPI00296FFC4F|nr:FMN-binding protein [Muricauda sp. D6]